MTATETRVPASAEPAPTTSTKPRVPDDGWRWLGLAIVLAVNGFLITTFFDHSWMPSDDGHYLHVADRLANGEVLNRDVEELHPGYVHFIHAWSLQLFGRDIVSLRFPIMALVALQSIGTYFMMRRSEGFAGVAAAVVGAITMAGIGAFQISNPTPSLYSLAVTVGIGWLAVASPVSSRFGPFSSEFTRAISFGILVGLLFLFRQLTAVFVLMGLLTFLFTEQRSRKPRTYPPGSRIVSQAVLAVALIGLIGYLFLSTGLVGVVLFGLWPVALLAWALTSCTASNRESVTILAGLALGAVGSAIPLVAYHLRHNSLDIWANDTFVRALSISELDHITTGSYLRQMAMPALGNLLAGPGLLEGLNGLYWIALVCLAFIAGAMVFVRVARRDTGLPGGAALPIVAVFHGLVSVFNQIPFYLYLTAGLSLTAIIWMSWTHWHRHGGRQFAAILLGALAFVGVGVWSHAGQPHTRSGNDIIAGVRAEVVPSSIPRFGLAVAPSDEALYQDLADAVHRYAAPTDAIFTMPNSAEVYFIANRQNPFRLFNPTISILDAPELDEFVAEFNAVQPAVIVHNTTSVYNTDLTADLHRRITEDYTLVGSVEQFDVWVHGSQIQSLRAGSG